MRRPRLDVRERREQREGELSAELRRAPADGVAGERDRPPAGDAAGAAAGAGATASTGAASTIVSAPPVHPEHRTPTPAQEKIQEHFRQGALYAKGAKGNPAYAPIAKDKHLSTYAVAMADFLHPPEIHDIDVSGYAGGVAQAIVIRATDDVKVTAVGVLITTDADVVVEKGKAVQSAHDPHVWTYTTTAAAPSASVKIVVDAADLAGQLSEQSAHT